jgi:phage terminase Nu1 subunit (DNA packaging protein)
MANRLLETAHFWAHQLGVSDKVVRGLLEGVAPDGMRGQTQPTYYLSTVIDVRQGQAGELDLNAERARLAKAQADKTEIENAVRCGELSETARVVDWYADMVTNAKNRLLQIPPTVGQQVDPAIAPRVMELVRKLVHEALLELSQGEAGKRKR